MLGSVYGAWRITNVSSAVKGSLFYSTASRDQHRLGKDASRAHQKSERWKQPRYSRPTHALQSCYNMGVDSSILDNHPPRRFRRAAHSLTPSLTNNLLHVVVAVVVHVLHHVHERCDGAMQASTHADVHYYVRRESSPFSEGDTAACSVRTKVQTSILFFFFPSFLLRTQMYSGSADTFESQDSIFRSRSTVIDFRVGREIGNA